MKNNKILNFLLLILVLGFITFLIPQSIGLGAKGFDSSLVLQQFSFYLVGGIFLMLIIVGFIYEYINKKGDNKYGSSIMFSDLGKFPSMKFFKRFTQLQLAFLSIIFFGILGMFSFFIAKQTTFTGIGSIEQQFTPASQLMFSASLVPGSENLGLAVVVTMSLIFLRIIARKYNMSKESFRLYTLLIPILGGTYWLINHLLRYSSQDITTVKVFFFGLIMTFLIILTGSFIPAWIMHITNNVFYELVNLFNRDIVIIYTISAIIILILIYSYLYKNRLFGRKNVIE